jgi:HAD superfamily hydrolase (TIGR01549 family)
MTTVPAVPLTPRAVLFDVDFTLLRPSEQFEAPGYQRMGARFGLALDPARWPQAERAAYAAVKARRARTGSAHDDGLVDTIARAVIEGMGGGEPEAVRRTAAAIAAAWSRTENFGLYDDVLPCLKTLRQAGLRIGLASNALGHDLEEVVAAFALEPYVDAAVSSALVGHVKPAPRLFAAALDAVDAAASETVMVGDSYEDDVAGALAYGFAGAVLLDRAGRQRRPAPTIRTLAELPPLLGI